MGLVSMAHASSHFAHLLLPLMFPVFMREFGLGYAQMGFLVTIFFVVSGLGQASAGFVVDRFGARVVMLVSVAVMGLACLVAASAQGYASLVAVAVLAGLGNSPFHPVDFTILNQRVSPSRLGHAYSAHGLSGNLGWALAPAFLAGLTAWSGWRSAYLGAALMYAALLLLLTLQRQHLDTETTSQRARSSDGAAPAPAGLGFLREPAVWWCFAFFLLSSITLAVVQAYGISLLKEMHGVSFEAASMTLTAYMLCGAGGMLCGGFVAARARSSDRVVAACLGAAAVLLLLCGSGWLGGPGTMVVLAATGFAVGIGGPSRDMMIKKATPKGATGRVYGLVYCGLDVGMAIAPLLFGVLMDRGWYGATFAGAAAAMLLSVVAALGVGQRTRTR